MRARDVAFVLGSCAACWLLVAAPAGAVYVNFEAGHVRPLALSPDGSRLFAVNTPDNQLTIFDVTTEGLALAAEVPVGLRPVAVAVRDTGGGVLEAWVVNHLSDSVSIVAVDSATPALSRVRKTLLVGDEPRDVVFAGTGGGHAFITTARRGQHDTVPAANLSTAGTARALVWVFDVTALGAGIGGTPVNVIELFTDTPRALAVSPGGGTVYAASFRSGNGSTVVSEATVTANGGVPSFPSGSTGGAPETSLIVRKNPSSGNFEDEDGTSWSSQIPFGLPDLDVFLIDATASPPALAPSPNSVARVGTVLFNMAVRPSNGHLFVSNMEFRNEVRFENLVGTTQGLQGHVAENHITVIDGTTPTAVHLNPHIDYSMATGSQGEIDQSLGMPLDMVFTADGATVYVAAFGSSVVAALDATALKSGTISGSQIAVPGGPSGLALDESRDRLYVMSRFDNEVTVIGSPAGAPTVLDTEPLPTPEPTAVTDGRRFLYDTRFSSGHGDAACGTCHLFGDMDKMAWDLGDPFGSVENNTNPMVFGPQDDFHPLKGPMTTQSLRGLPGQGPLHWRGDQFGPDPFDVAANFDEFGPAFVSLLGQGSQPTAQEFQQFSDFVMTLRYPPNPVRALDDVPSADEASGESIFVNDLTAVIFTCNDCHALPSGTSGESLGPVQGIETQVMKIPHLRNMYDKVGAFSVSGDQVSGFGLIHDGSIYSMFDFLQVFPISQGDRDDIEAFQNALDTGVKPAVGQQVSATAADFGAAPIVARVGLLEAQADAGHCDLVVKGINAGEARGAVYLGGGVYQSDKAGEPSTNSAALRGLAASAGQEQVFTCVPLATGTRLGINRDEDTHLDGDDNCAGVVNDPQTDTDEDGIGDLCDPTPLPEPGQLVMFLSALPLLRRLARRRTARP